MAVRSKVLGVALLASFALAASACTQLPSPPPEWHRDGAIAYQIFDNGNLVDEGGGPVTMHIGQATYATLPIWVQGVEDSFDRQGTIETAGSFVGLQGSYPVYLDYDLVPPGGLCQVYFCGSDVALNGVNISLPDGSANIVSTSIGQAPPAPAGTCDSGEIVSRVLVEGDVVGDPATTVAIAFWICGGMTFP